MVNRSKSWVFAAVTIGILIAIFASIPIRTKSRIKAYKQLIKPGMRLDELTNVMGPADRIIGPDRHLDRAHRYNIPPLASNTIIYFYPKEGLPYFNIFVFVDEVKGEVIDLVVDQMN